MRKVVDKIFEENIQRRIELLKDKPFPVGAFSSYFELAEYVDNNLVACISNLPGTPDYWCRLYLRSGEIVLELYVGILENDHLPKRIKLWYVDASDNRIVTPTPENIDDLSLLEHRRFIETYLFRTKAEAELLKDNGNDYSNAVSSE